MIEDVRIAVEVVETLGGQHHAHILAAIKEWDSPQEEVFARHLH